MAIMMTSSLTMEAGDFFWGNLAGSMEAIDAGTTTVLDHAHMNWSPNHSPQAIAGTITSGVRSIFGYTPYVGLQSHKPAIEFRQDLLAPWVMETFEKLATSQSLSDAESRVKMGLGFDLYFLPKEMVQDMFSKVRSLGAGIITSHYIRPKGEADSSLPALLHSYGLLDERIVLSHAGGATPEDAKLMSEAKSYVSVTPSAEQSMCVGPSVAFREDLPGMEKVCSLGIDCQCINSSSIVNEMRTSLQTARAHDSIAHQKQGKLPKTGFHTCAEAFNMGTIQGARALCMEKEIGSIQVGKKADLVVFDAMSPAMIGAAQRDPVMAIVLHSSIGDVDAVIVDGQFRKRNGKLLPVQVTKWQDENNFEETDESISWGFVAGQLLALQQRFLSKLPEYDLPELETAIKELFHMP
ncbi:5'-deoxyadenosine deaminase-like protein [Cladobotryum mycophilum]|uniref:5'-deoxyadenosine deaminase-like protein n=1 Tax=Cladobotryum mycophilum TaxID=491253 RepID=A0ABR0SC83_9HYPO